MAFNNNPIANLVVIIIAVIFLTACNSTKKNSILQNAGRVKNYTPNKPFIYNKKIEIISSSINADEIQRLKTELNNYWDDSLIVKKKTSWLFFKAIKSPPLFNIENVERSIKYMQGYLKTQGYYNTTFSYDSLNLVKKNEHRVAIIINISLNKNISLDSVGFELIDSNLQKIAIENQDKSLLKKGQPYTKQVISNELDRLTNLFNNKGYFNFRKDDLYAWVDTTDERFLNLTTDPFELIKLLDEYNKSKLENPKWDVIIKQRQDTTGLSSKKYFIGQIHYYPQAKNFELIDSTINKFWLHSHTSNNYTLHFDNEIIKLQPLVQYTFVKNGEPYDNTKVFNTLSSLNKLGPWKQIDAKFIIRNNDTLDLHIALVPDKKYGIENSGEISRNTGDLTAGNFIGISENFTFRNRNIWKSAVQSFTTLRAGIELAPTDSSNALQTVFGSLTHTYSFPKIIFEKSIKNFFKILPTKWLRNNLLEILESNNKRSLITFNASYSDRLGLFRLKSLTGNFGYEIKKDDKTWLYNPINIELYSLEERQGLTKLIEQNPFLRLSFNTGNVIGQTFNYLVQKNNPKKDASKYLRIGVEESGLIAGLFASAEDNIYRFGKFEVEHRYNKKYLNKTEFAYKLFGGVGFNYSNSSSLGVVLPFFKQFFVGGPNSMRAWGLRQLGQGSSITTDTSGSSFKDRFGDMRLEANFEYRFNLLTTSFVKIGSAFYADIGNVWNIKKYDNNPNGEFAINRLYRDLAIGIGTGLRFDFSIFLIRIDAAYKFKDPARQYNDGWVDLKSMSLSEYRSNGVEVRNAAIQLGIGLPF